MICAFDIGGSKIAAATPISGDPARLKPLGEVPTPTQDFDGFCAALAALLPAGTHRAGVSVAGVIGPEGDRLSSANIPCIHGRALARELTERLGLPVDVINDANAFGLAESVLGCGAGHRVVFAAILGTGIGGAVVIDGRVHEGRAGTAGEWGHGPASAADAAALPRLPCGCGQTGCVDTLGGARGLERLHHHLYGRSATSHEILSGWHAGDPAAGHTLGLYLDVVGGALAAAANLIDPSIVPVGGGLGQDARLVAALDAEVRARMIAPSDAPLLRQASLQPHAGLIGAAIHAGRCGDDRNA